MIAAIRRVFGGLAFRVAALLVLALLPIGIIAIYQTATIERETARRDEASLLALTAQAATSEESLIRAAFGSLTALASTIGFVKDEPAVCDALFADFILQSPQFSFAGYISTDGYVRCGSAGRGSDVSAEKTFREMKADPKPRSVINLDPSISKTSIIALSLPIMSGETFDGYVTISLPHAQIFKGMRVLSPDRPIDLVTFNEQGNVLSAEAGIETADLRLPQAKPLLSFVGKTQLAFSGPAGDGLPRVFAVVPILENNVYAIGSWRPLASGGTFSFSPIIFPALMWLTSFAVAYFAVHRLAIKHIKRLGRDMELFVGSGQLAPSVSSFGIPSEMRDIDASWHNLALTVVSDQAKLEDTIRDKTVLLKEVHHRVKNNLQLISSIVSLKTRTAATLEARAALREVQMRVMSMATVHRALYETSTEGRVRADELLQGIAQRTIDAGLTPNLAMDVVQSYDPVTLFPDQAVPLSMLATEAITNALKYIGHPANVTPSLAIRLGLVTNSSAYFEVENSKGIQLTTANKVKGTGLGNALIVALVQQAGGTLKVSDEPSRYHLRVDFPIVDFRPEPIETSMQ